MVLLDTGLRASELCAVNVGDVDTRAGTILVKKGKGRKERTVFMGARTGRQVARLLGQMEHPAPTAPLIVSTGSGRRLTYSGLGHIMARLRERTEIAHLSAHTFRRTFAIWSLRSGMSIYHLQRLMGHADIGTLKHYLGLIEADLQTAHAEHGPVDHGLK
jgi:integrase/recombinase XerD